MWGLPKTFFVKCDKKIRGKFGLATKIKAKIIRKMLRKLYN